MRKKRKTKKEEEAEEAPSGDAGPTEEDESSEEGAPRSGCLNCKKKIFWMRSTTASRRSTSKARQKRIEKSKRKNMKKG